MRGTAVPPRVASLKAIYPFPADFGDRSERDPEIDQAPSRCDESTEPLLSRLRFPADLYMSGVTISSPVARDPLAHLHLLCSHHLKHFLPGIGTRASRYRHRRSITEATASHADTSEESRGEFCGVLIRPTTAKSHVWCYGSSSITLGAPETHPTGRQLEFLDSDVPTTFRRKTPSW